MLFYRDRASEIMELHELDALVSCSFENVFYTSSLSWTPWSIGIRGEWNFIFTVIPLAKVIESTIVAPKIIDAWPQLIQSSRTWIKDVRYYGENWYDRSKFRMNRLERAFVKRMKITAKLDPIVTLADVLKEKGLAKGRIAIEKNALNFSGEFREIGKLQRLLPNVNFVEASSILREIRMVKSTEEIERLEHALRVNEYALQVAFNSLRNGNEINSKRLVANAITERGGIPLNVGIRASRTPTPDRGSRFKEGDLVSNDYLISYDGYCSDTARMAAVGKPRQMAGKVCDMLAEAVGRVVELAKPGTRVSRLYEEATSLIRAKLPYSHGKFGPCLGHGIGVCLGNCLGICPHEEPWLVATSDSVLEPGMIINVEIPYNSLGVGVFNIEETIQITDKGSRRLSRLPRELYIA